MAAGVLLAVGAGAAWALPSLSAYEKAAGIILAARPESEKELEELIRPMGFRGEERIWRVVDERGTAEVWCALEAGLPLASISVTYRPKVRRAMASAVISALAAKASRVTCRKADELVFMIGELPGPQDGAGDVSVLEQVIVGMIDGAWLGSEQGFAWKRVGRKP